MKKKSKADIGKIVEAKAKGRQGKRRVASEEVVPESAEVDSRFSKWPTKIGGN